MDGKFILIDGHSILNRAFYGVPDLSNHEGIHTNAMYGFLNIMFRFIDEEQPDCLAVAFDLSAPTFRHKAYEGYKGTRKPMAPELKQQVPLIKELLKAMQIAIVEMEGYEADDILGTLAKTYEAEGMSVTVISGDRDLLQLAGPNIKIRIPKTKKGVTEVEDYLPADVEALYGVTPQEFIDVKALMGDASDNIPGAPGIGPKTASALIAKYHSLDNIFANLPDVTPPKARKSIEENMEQIKLSYFLSKIDVHVPVEFSIEDAAVKDFFTPEAYELFEKYNFKSFMKRFGEHAAQNEPEIFKSFRLADELSDAQQVFERAEEQLGRGGCIAVSVLYEEQASSGVSVCLSPEDVCFIAAGGFITDNYLNDWLRRLAHAAQQSGRRVFVTSGLKSILDVFRENGETLPGVQDTAFADVSLGAYLINPNRDNYEYDRLAADFLGMHVPSRKELLGKLSLKEAAAAQPDVLCRLACMESCIYYMAWQKISKELEQEEMSELFNNIEMPLLFVLYGMEAEGIRVDREQLKEYGDMLEAKIAVLQQEIYDEAGEKFNINSPKQLGYILFDKLKMPYGKKTKSGYSTAADVLEKLAPDYPLVEKILEYRQLAKLKSTYADGLASYISADGRIHGKFNQTITATGRISSTEPNLQNIPIRMELGKQIRKVFIPRDGYVFLDADYSQIELRILAALSGDEKLIAAYNSAEDIHRITASEVFNVPFEEVTPLQRRNAKAVNFGIIYGISSFGLSQDLSISRQEAADYIEQYFRTYPGIKSFIDGMVEDAKKRGYSLTMHKRRRPIPELKSSNYMQRSFGERAAMNAPIQGTAADIIKLAMISVYKELLQRGLKSRLILQVHDELLVEAEIGEAEQVKEIIERGMKQAASLSVPLEIDLQQGANWFEAH